MCSISANLGPAHGSYAGPVPLRKGDYLIAAPPHKFSPRHSLPLTSANGGAKFPAALSGTPPPLAQSPL